MENTQNQAPTQEAKPSKKYQNSRTHIPVDGHKIEELRTLSLEELIIIANSVGVENPREFRRQDLIFEILKTQTKQGGFILFTGILEVTNEGYGFLRSVDANLSDSSNDAYVSNSQIRKFALRVGDIVTGQVR